MAQTHELDFLTDHTNLQPTSKQKVPVKCDKYESLLLSLEADNLLEAQR